ncbi:lipopolysaccharide biosynthesis protein [Photorhabdus bodei]|uniref:Lipopolysaccharide biosynthesis protein n=2 Tax=Photorhabdus bodei TaxID=2029681 RepID=A0A329X6G2_9GAMM|nr:lipopolysaccharide biosynthesis protein [Photorhabdus bodei]
MFFKYKYLLKLGMLCKQNITKSIYRNVSSKKMKHNMNFWPHIKISRNINGKIDSVSFNKKNININEFPKKSEKPLIIIASGPSVSTIKTDFFDDTKFDIMGVNGSYELSPEVKFKYHVIIDRTFILNRKNIVLNILKDDELILFTTMDCLNDILIHYGDLELTCKVIIIENIDQPVYQEEKELFEIKSDEIIIQNGVAFSLNLNLGFYNGTTVAYSALQIALFLGYKKIYFAGLDMNNFSKPRFYETQNDQLDTKLNNNLHDFIIPCFNLAHEIAIKRGVKIYNLSKNSAINSFEKLDYREI